MNPKKEPMRVNLYISGDLEKWIAKGSKSLGNIPHATFIKIMLGKAMVEEKK